MLHAPKSTEAKDQLGRNVVLLGRLKSGSEYRGVVRGGRKHSDMRPVRISPNSDWAAAVESDVPSELAKQEAYQIALPFKAHILSRHF